VIVRPVGDRIQLITQPDHAHLARRVMEHCVPLATRSRRDAILHAIAEHDNGWAEEDAAPHANPETGQVFDFVTAPASVRQHVWPRGVARLADDPWAAALVAQHAITIYVRFRLEHEWQPFFAEMEDARDRMLRASGGPLNVLLADYVFVRLADLISLTFCTGWTDEQRFGEWTVRRFDARVVVAPDAFGGTEIPIEIAAKEIRHHPSLSDADLRAALGEAHTTILRGTVTSAAFTTLDPSSRG
jgi:Protein of unknown function (DUF3891)